jgi:ribosomal protein S15P/S13E
MLGQERVSIDEDIQILTQRAEAIRERLKTKKEALKSVTALTA